MLMMTCDIPAGTKAEILGGVRGNVVYCKNLGRDIMAGFKNIKGGEIKSYTQLTNEARSIAESRMVEQAAALGANAIVCMRFSSSSLAEGSIEMLSYGTAVKLS